MPAFHRHEAIVEAQDYRAYRDVLRIALERAVVDAEETAITSGLILGDDWRRLPVFADTAAALAELRDDGWSLGVLTNCDDDLFAETSEAAGFAFDRVVTAQEVRSYKPAPAHFFRFRETVGDETPWVHVACSWFHDIVPAHKFGIPRVWVDREDSGDDPALATAVLPNLQGLATLLRTIFR